MVTPQPDNVIWELRKELDNMVPSKAQLKLILNAVMKFLLMHILLLFKFTNMFRLLKIWKCIYC